VLPPQFRELLEPPEADLSDDSGIRLNAKGESKDRRVTDVLTLVVGTRSGEIFELVVTLFSNNSFKFKEYSLSKNHSSQVVAGLEEPRSGNRLLKVAMHPKIDIMATIGRDRLLCLWDLKKKQIIDRNFLSAMTVATCLKYSPDGSLLLIGYMDGSVKVFESQIVEIEFRRDAVRRLGKPRRNPTAAAQAARNHQAQRRHEQRARARVLRRLRPTRSQLRQQAGTCSSPRGTKKKASSAETSKTASSSSSPTKTQPPKATSSSKNPENSTRRSPRSGVRSSKRTLRK